MARRENFSDHRPVLWVISAGLAAAVAWLLTAVLVAGRILPAAPGTTGGHLAVNLHGDYAGAAAAGFTLVDAGSAAALDALPPGVRGVLWLGNGYNSTCSWRLDDKQVTAQVEAARDDPHFSGTYYISDEPHPATCPDAPRRIAERTALIHRLDPKGRTFIVVENGGAKVDEFRLLADSADLIGVAPYPCNRANAKDGCDLLQLRERILAARDAGIPVDRIVPVFQAFGQACAGIEKPWYRLPTEQEMAAMLRVWDELVPRSRRAFDMTYSWASQKGSSCPTLAQANGDGWPDLRSVLSKYFAGHSAPAEAGSAQD